VTVAGEQERSKVRRQRILDAALDVFTRRGYRDAAVDDIAVASSTSKGGVYFHFPNKAAIFQALVRRTSGLLMARVEAALSEIDDPILKVDAALATVLRLFAEHRTLARLFLVEALAAGPEFSSALMEVHEEVARLIARHLDEAVRAGAIAPIDVEQAGVAWFGALNEVMVRWVLTGRPERLEEVYPALRALLLRSIGAPHGSQSTSGSPSAQIGALPMSAEALKDRLRSARRLAGERGDPVLVTLSHELERHDPLDLFAQADTLGYDRVYWEQPAERLSIGGVGAAWTAEGSDPVAAGWAWSALLRHALPDAPRDSATGPLLLGGFAFDADWPPSSLWQGFPAGRLVLPRVMLRTCGERSTLTVNAVVEASTDPEAEAARLLRWVETVFPLSRRPERWQGSDLITDDLLAPDAWQEIVAAGASACRDQGSGLDKVVLARAMRARARAPIDAAAVLSRLRAAYPMAYVYAIGRGVQCLAGASPERLVRLRGGVVEVACLAGSAPRGETAEEDAYLGGALLASAKDRAEHAFVVQGVREALADLCDEIAIPPAPRLMRLPTIQHLYTPVTARAAPDTAVLDVVRRLHPTPAVGGLPRAAALSYIREHEGLDRGWYAGPVGWLDARGDGEFAVALRCALINGAEATLFAGCGIVGDSQPVDEFAETNLKLRVMLNALTGGPR
jgi:salicylate biosynthesis isochorismate synthase/menaquinone-specific isochorismate synthase